MGIRRRLESWLSWFPWYRRQTREADLARELRDHLELEAEEQRAAGLSPEEAAHAAHRALGILLDPQHVPALRVVGDTRSVSLSKAPAPMVYALYSGGLTASLILRARLPATAVASELRRAIWSVDSSVAVPPIRSMGQIVSTSLAPRRFGTLLTSLFAAAALLLVCLGIYGVVSYSVARRTHEIGIRMALGAQSADVLGHVMGQAVMPALLGLGAGIIGSLGLTRLLSSLLYGIKPTDPLTFGAVPLILTAVILLACYVPARRAMRVDPVTALRYE